MRRSKRYSLESKHGFLRMSVSGFSIRIRFKVKGKANPVDFLASALESLDVPVEVGKSNKNLYMRIKLTRPLVNPWALLSAWVRMVDQAIDDEIDAYFCCEGKGADNQSTDWEATSKIAVGV